MLTTYDVSVPEGRRLYIEDFWLNFASFAYDQYVHLGRGAVLLSGTSLDENEMMYIAIEQLMNYPEIVKAVQEYDPETQIVVIMALPGILALQTYKGEPPPPSTYRAMNRRNRKNHPSV